MAVTVRKYNPGFQTDDELVKLFCVRTAEFDSIIESLNDSAGGPSAHTIVVGPRGSGKTHLLLTVAAEMRREEKVEGYFPIVFAEESYEVSSHGELWLECLGRLAEQAPAEERNSLRMTYEELQMVRDDGVLSERCMGALLDFSDRHGRRLALIVENLNMLLPDMTDPDAGWKLRSVLQTEPRITLLCSATSRFEEIDHPDQPLYDIFRAVTLRPLNTEECEVLWSTVSGQPAEPGTIRPLQILTGGSPRMIAVVAGFRATHSFGELMNNLLELIDDHTEYFKGHIDALPSQERRVYLALARIWKSATAREVADQARIDTSKCSAFLRRLVDRGAVTEEGGTPRRRQYYLTERLYNIYYLLRRPSGKSQVVRALIEFMACCYSPEQMLDIARRIAKEYKEADTQLMKTQQHALEILFDPLEMKRLYEATDVERPLAQVISAGSDEADDHGFSGEFDPQDMLRVEGSEIEPSFVGMYYGGTREPSAEEKRAQEMVDTAHKLVANGEHDKAIALYDEVIRLPVDNTTFEVAMQQVVAHLNKMFQLYKIGRLSEGSVACDDLLTRYGKRSEPVFLFITAIALDTRGVYLLKEGKVPEAVSSLSEALARLDGWGSSEHTEIEAGVIKHKWQALLLADRLDEAIDSMDETVKRYGSSGDAELSKYVAEALVTKAVTLRRTGRAMSEGEHVLLLDCAGRSDQLEPVSIEILTQFAAEVGASQALCVIQDSRAAGLLLPLTTALQQELGLETSVAKEVDEVARDIRRKLLTYRNRIGSGGKNSWRDM